MRFIPVTPRTESSELPFLFQDFFTDVLNRSSYENSQPWVPAVDILEKDGNLLLKAELPGIDEKQIDLQLEGHVLTIKGERKLENEDDRKNYHRMETYYGSFSRSFTLPETVDSEKIKAEYKNGILTVTIPQKPEVRPRTIPVAIQ